MVKSKTLILENLLVCESCINGKMTKNPLFLKDIEPKKVLS